MSDDWKQQHATEAEKALEHPIVASAIAELRDNLGISENSPLPAYGIVKVATYAAQVARAQALGIDPEALRLTADEVRSEMLRLAAEAAFDGVPVDILDAEDGQEGRLP
jgi:hypothetical protein